MPEPINLSGRLEVRNSSGVTVGYLVPASEVNGTPDTWRAELEAERTRLAELVRTLTAERDQLREELARALSKAEDYRSGLCGLMEHFAPTEAEMAEMETNGLSLDDLIAELERSQGT